MLNRAADVARGSPAARAARWLRPSVSRLSLVLGACGLVFITGTAGFIALHERDVMLREARDRTRSAAFSLSDHAARLFEVSDLALRTTILALNVRSWPEVDASRPLWQELRSGADALPYIRDLLLADETGALRLGTMAFPLPPSSVADRQAFIDVAAGADGLVIGDPLTGRITGQPSFLIARRLVNPDGGFRGMAAATADLAYFTSYWRRLDLQNDTHVAIVRAANGSILVRTPLVPPVAPTSIAALRAAAALRPEVGSYVPAPGRLAFYDRIGDLPLYLTVSFSESSVEHDWRAWLWSFAVFPGLAMLALLVLMVLARRQSRVEALASRDVMRARAQLAASNQRLEQRVAERTLDLRESNAEIQRFAYIVSHDLRAPLVNIMGFTSELQRLRHDLFPDAAADAAPAPAPADGLREDFDEAIGFIKTSIGKMDRLINAILLLARQGTRSFEPEPVDMEALMRSIADGVAHRVQSSGAAIAIGPLPALVIDRIAAEQVFSNLVDNAVKYLRPGVPGEIVVSGMVEGTRAVLRIADNGRGIAAGDHARVFELFRRSGQQNQPGDGIGLAHVRTLVRQLGGTISLESVLGQGSTFTVVLPLGPEGAAP